MKRSIVNNAGLLLLAIVFSTALIFAFIELPRLLDAALQNKLGFPGFDHGLGETAALKTELFIRGLHLRWIGYGSLLLIAILILVGYTSRKSGWAMAGAIGLFIPVFGQFAMSMFFLAGLGFLRVSWLPFMEVSSIDLLDLGKVIYVPYWILMWFFGLFNWYAHNFLSCFFMSSGALLFTWGVLLWFKSRYEGNRVATSWIYKISRHPQYLGWILWSYGFALYTPGYNNMKISWTVPSSLPWLLMTMTIVGICLMEETKMMERTGGAYEEYRKKTPFLFPLPSFLNRILTWPARFISRTTYPTKPRQVLAIVLLYTGIFIALSFIWIEPSKDRPADSSGPEARKELSELISELKSAEANRRLIYSLISQVPGYGRAGYDSLLVLVKDDNPQVREFAIMLLGDLNIAEGEDLYIASLYDSIRRVRSASIITLGQIKSEKAVDSLIGLIEHPLHENRLFHIYETLGSIGDPRSIPILEDALKSGAFYNQESALGALMDIDPELGVRYAMEELLDEDIRIRRNAVITCIQADSPLAIEALRACFEDEDFEVRFYAKQGVKLLEE